MIVRQVEAVLLAALFGVAACTEPVGVGHSSAATMRPATAAYVMPAPGGPGIVGVVERRSSNATSQEIALTTDAATPGQNSLRVHLVGAGGRRGNAMGDVSPGDGDLTREMRSALPGVAMAVSPLFAQNHYGPFGYATGRGHGRDLCLYAWQHVGGGMRGSVQIRLRLCEAGASERALLAVMYGFTINAFVDDPDWQPYAQPTATPIAAVGMPVHPLWTEAEAPARAVRNAAPRAPSAGPAVCTAAATSAPSAGAAPLAAPALAAPPANAAPVPAAVPSIAVSPLVPPPMATSGPVVPPPPAPEAGPRAPSTPPILEN